MYMSRVILFLLLVKFINTNPELPTTNEIEDVLSPELVVEEAFESSFFAAVIDAGSTGTRLHLFEFRHSIEDDSQAPFELIREIFKEVKPGLSSFADDPKKAAESVKILLNHAKNVIPKKLLKHTPIILQATAGLRLLSEKDADAILEYVEKEVHKTGMLVGDESVGILSGRDEGIFGWFTLNFLTGRLSFTEEDSKDRTAVALDLGGGSTQITFNQGKENFDDERTHNVNIFGRIFDLYTHSYLGNGLIAARLGISTIINGIESTNLKTHCLPKDVKINDWSYAGKLFQITATNDASFEKCHEQAIHFVEKISNVTTIENINDLPIFAFSYFYDRGLQAELIRTEPKTRGGWIQINQYKLAAKEACKLHPDQMGSEHWRPWMCMDLTYIYTLLSTGYGLEDDKNIHLTKKMKDMEVSWALGAGFHLLNSYHSEHFNNFNKRNSSSLFNNVVNYLSTTATNVLMFLNILS